MNEEQNRIIAEFMQAEYKADDYGDMGYWFKTVPAVSEWQTGFKVEALKYHTSFDWLMPVVERIEAMGYTVSIAKQHCFIMKDNAIRGTEVFSDTKLSATYQAVLKFIEFYNEQLKGKSDEQ